MRVQACRVALALVAIALGSQAIQAQGIPGATYRPSQPTFSPWLNLYQKNSGPLDNYHTYVRPEMQLRDTLRQQHTMLREQGEGILELSGQMEAVQHGRSPAHPTGAGSVFMDYGHYYDLKSPASRLRGVPQRTSGRTSHGAY